jgi:hypothetical protein
MGIWRFAELSLSHFDEGNAVGGYFVMRKTA